ncbi:MAG: hypothetical protein AMS19_09915 [Gemmatimonas sp. SG8_23]|nr:MAG: hypothetical protein AMS19_09915 [Gemmatimonas sp. SG8_23]
MLGMPFGAIAGIVWGVFASADLVGGTLFWAAVGAFSFVLFMDVQLRLIGPIGRIVNRLFPSAGGLAGLAWEALAVGVVFFLVTSVLGAPLVPAVGTALGLGAGYVALMEYLLCGSAGSDLSKLVHGAGAFSAGRTRDTLSHAEALAQRGQVDEAAALLLESIGREPGRATPYLRLSALRMQEEEYDQAVELLRAALDRARLGDEEEAFVVRRIYETCAGPLADPARATKDLEWLVERQRNSAHATWARWRLREIRRGSRDD